MYKKTAVVVSTWSGSDPVLLKKLTASMENHNSKYPYDKYLVNNGRVMIHDRNLYGIFRGILHRENRGYNIAAWDAAWRMLNGYDYFLFVQDDCYVRRNGWLRGFVKAFEKDSHSGLIGENLNSRWDRRWSDLLAHNDAAPSPERARFYHEKLLSWNIDVGDKATHLTTVVLFTSREVLEKVNGFPIPDSYQDAIAAEIGFSRKIVSAGKNIKQVKGCSHFYIGHAQWESELCLVQAYKVIKSIFFSIIDRLVSLGK